MYEPLALATALAHIIDPMTQQPWVNAKNIQNLQFKDGHLSFEVQVGYPCQSMHLGVEGAIDVALLKLDGVKVADAKLKTHIVAHAVGTLALGEPGSAKKGKNGKNGKNGKKDLRTSATPTTTVARR